MEGKHRYIDTKCANMLSAYNHFWQRQHKWLKTKDFWIWTKHHEVFAGLWLIGAYPYRCPASPYIEVFLVTLCPRPCHPCRRTWSAGVCRGRPWSWGPGWGQRPERAGLGYWPAWSLLRTQSAASDEVSLAELLLPHPELAWYKEIKGDRC